MSSGTLLPGGLWLGSQNVESYADEAFDPPLKPIAIHASHSSRHIASRAPLTTYPDPPGIVRRLFNTLGQSLLH